MGSACLGPKVIPLSGAHCTNKNHKYLIKWHLLYAQWSFYFYYLDNDSCFETTLSKPVVLIRVLVESFQLILSLQIESVESRELWEDSILLTILVMLGSLLFYAKAYCTESTLKQSYVLMVSGQVTFQRRYI
jgi:hypothetical protein